MTRRQLMRAVGSALPFVVILVLPAPLWLFLARLWWSWTHALLTKPWDQIFRIGAAS